MVVNAINGNIGTPKNVINLVEDIKSLFIHVNGSRLENYSRIINRDVDGVAKMAHM